MEFKNAKTGPPLALAARTGRALTATAASTTLQYTDDELEFLRAIDKYKRANHRPFPTWHEVLAVLKSLGYRKAEG